MININPVRFANINNVYAQQPKTKLTGLASDVFVRSNAPSFKCRDDESFMDWAKKTNYVMADFPHIFFSDNTVIGSGFNHTTYMIPETDKYILRGPNEQIIKTVANQIDFQKTTIEDIEDKNLKINIGQPVASIKAQTKIGIPIFFEVLKKQEGTSIGVPPYSALSDEYGNLKPGIEPYEAESRKVKYAESIKEVANMPIEAYETLISELEEAAKAGYKFDYLNSNNILLDEKNKRFNLIDMDKVSNPENNTVNYGNVLYALTNYCYYDTYTSNSFMNRMISPIEKEEAAHNTIKTIQKFVIAMQKKGVKFDKANKSYEFDKLLGSKVIDCLNDSDKNKWSYFERNQVA